MAKTKKRNEGRIRKSASGDNPDRAKEVGKGGQNMRTKATIKRLNMYRGGKAVRNRKGKIVKPPEFQGELPSGTQARVEPNRRWFGNTRVIAQKNLQRFQKEIGNVMKDPYQLVLRTGKLPMSLLHDRAKNARVHILDTESFGSTFGKKSTRKRPSLKFTDLESLSAEVEKSSDLYKEEKDLDLVREDDGTKNVVLGAYFTAGQSKRIWNELYKVVDCSDVIIQVLDVRDPMGTRCPHVERYLAKEKPHKHLIFILNKVDLVPTWVTKSWVATLSKERPTLAFHASITNPFGKGALINLLRQFGKLHSDKKNISCGFIGYPNVGKSSIINTLRKKKVCNVAPIAGETKVWQYITLMKKIFLVDCPGIVYPSGDTETEIILKGVIRVEHVKNPEDHIPEVLNRVKKEYISRQYQIIGWTDHEDFLEQMARRTGKLLKGGEPDVKTVSKMILNDWQRGKIPYFIIPDWLKEKQQQMKDDLIVEIANQSTAEVDDSNDPTLATEMEKNLQPIKQNLSEVKVDLDFDKDDAAEDDLENENQEVSSNIEVMGNDDNVESKSNVQFSGAKRKSVAELDDKIEKYRKYLKTDMKKRQDTVFNFDPEASARNMSNSEKSKTKAKNETKDIEISTDNLTSKQKRRLERKKKSKKTGVHYYSEVNVKNKNRNKTPKL
uniref:nucleolar GTP-binding protein 2-like n=1 Tax=Styela clava TaxID=7725 RepID=UPI00193AA476|nr:nucleolar GTP-binding protein 2-like [Styela clava]